MLPQSDSCFMHFQEISPELHTLIIKDFTHELSCDMVLEVKKILVFPEGEEEGYLEPIIACSFPAINVKRFNEKIGYDPYLQGTLTYQFHLKILEGLLLFCEQKNAVNITLTFNDTEEDYMEIYRGFSVSEERVNTVRGEMTQLVIGTDVTTYDKVIDQRDKIDRKFHKALWRGQKSNAAFRNYLKSNTCLQPAAECL